MTHFLHNQIHYYLVRGSWCVWVPAARELDPVINQAEVWGWYREGRGA